QRDHDDAGAEARHAPDGGGDDGADGQGRPAQGVGHYSTTNCSGCPSPGTGEGEKTPKPPAMIRRVRRASMTASWSMTPPRETLMRTALRFICSSSGRPMRWRGSLFSGTWEPAMSASR